MLFDIDKKCFPKPPIKTFCYRRTQRGFHVRFYLRHDQVKKYLPKVIYWAMHNCDIIKFAYDIDRGWSALASEKWIVINERKKGKKTGKSLIIHTKAGRWKQAQNGKKKRGN